MIPKPSISVIVCAYKAKKDIKDCLDSILNQSYPRDNYEIIVVVDDEETYEIIKDYSIVKYYRKKKGTIPHARNDGIRIAKGEVVAFTDSDCVVDKTWLENIAESFSQYPEIVGVSGPILPYENDSISRTIAILNLCGYSSGDFSFEKEFSTSNVAYTKRILEKISGFDEKALRGEDLDLYLRLKENGYAMLFNPNVSVYHKHRTKLLQIFFWCYKSGKESLYIYKKHKLYGRYIRSVTPSIFSLFVLIIILSLFVKNFTLLSILLILFFLSVAYLISYLVGRNRKYFDLKTFFILPVIVLIISNGLLLGNLAGLLNTLINKIQEKSRGKKHKKCQNY